MAMNEIEELITIGSKYRIMSASNGDHTLVSVGEFRGYAAFSNETALVLRLDDSEGQEGGRIRFLPYHVLPPVRNGLGAADSLSLIQLCPGLS